MKTISREQRILGALWGSLCGDALGVPVEFLSREMIRANPVTGMRGHGTHGQPAGTWSDDSSLLLCTAESLALKGSLDLADMGARFVRWQTQNHWTPHGAVFDIGITTAHSLLRIARGTPPEQAGGARVTDNGNGSLMRILPIALWFAGKPVAETVLAAHIVSALTHRHPRSQMACALYCLVVRKLLGAVSPEEALHGALKTFATAYDFAPFLAERLSFQLLEAGDLATRPESEIGSSGYVLHTLTAGLWCLLTTRSFDECVLKAVNLGLDTDTTGTVAGGLAGAWYGIESVPEAWKRGLARHDDVAALFQTFLHAIPE